MARGKTREIKGNYYVYITDDNGQEHSYSVRKETGKKKVTQRDADKVLAKKLAELESNGALFDSTKTLNEFLDEFLETKKDSIEYTTYEGYEQQLRLHIRPDLGEIRLCDLNTATIQKLVNKKKQTTGVRTIHYFTDVLSIALEMAIKWNLIKTNPVKQVELPKYVKKEKVIWSTEQFFQYMEQTEKDTFFLIFLVIVTGGLRRGEALALEWSDLDSKNNRLTINKQLTAKREIKTVKSKASNRISTIPPSVTKKLLEHRKRQLAFYMARGIRPDNNAIFTTSNGTYFLPGNVLRHFKNDCQKLNLPVVDIHSLRHLHVSIMINQGVDIKTIQSRVGHAKLSTTLDIYSHLLQKYEEESAKKMEDFIKQSI